MLLILDIDDVHNSPEWSMTFSDQCLFLRGPPLMRSIDLSACSRVYLADTQNNIRVAFRQQPHSGPIVAGWPCIYYQVIRFSHWRKKSQIITQVNSAGIQENTNLGRTLLDMEQGLPLTFVLNTTNKGIWTFLGGFDYVCRCASVTVEFIV